MEKKRLGERLREAREELGISQHELARRCGVSQGTIGQLENNRNETSKYLSQIARTLGVSVDWLETGKGDRNNTQLLPNSTASNANITEQQQFAVTGRVPLIELWQAPHWGMLVNNFVVNAKSYDPKSSIPTTVPIKHHTYAVRVQGDYMEPRFPDGCTIVVEPEEVAQHGSFVIVAEPGGDVTFKQLMIDGSKKYLKPLNTRYEPMLLHPDATICGVVKQMFQDFS